MSGGDSPYAQGICETMDPQINSAPSLRKQTRGDDHLGIGSDRMDILTPDPTSVYRYYDKNDLLLYVGITRRGISRNHEHNATKDWWPFVVRQEVEHFPHRFGALQHERFLIRKFTPPFNKQHNPGHEHMRALYLASGLGEKRKKRDGGNVTITSAPARRMFAAMNRLPLNLIDMHHDAATYASQPEHWTLAREAFRRGDVMLRDRKKVAQLADIAPHGNQMHYTFTGFAPGFQRPRVIEVRLKATQRPFSIYLFEAAAA